MSGSQTYLQIDIKEITGGHGLVFHQEEIRKGMRMLGREVQQKAQDFVRSKRKSGADEYPGRVTGNLLRSIRYSVSKPGFLVVIRPQKTNSFGNKEFYPSFLHYGVHNFRRKDHSKHSDKAAFRIAPRKNYMADALEAKQNRVRTVLFAALQKGLTAE